MPRVDISYKLCTFYFVYIKNKKPVLILKLTRNQTRRFYLFLFFKLHIFLYKYLKNSLLFWKLVTIFEINVKKLRFIFHKIDRILTLKTLRRVSFALMC